ncbi:related to Leucine Rich Repeat domain protein [Rhynchosporium agropyri]|uniref:Related to Leucine Rich Repeat domain protein n=1 Tax=Rhynchosporium agropyri TaxID=914238 RepID=A0A1E1JWF8_9HELO|nr:related to Leucine Rich Repeat domain protein [Rhynchosporium agropyri]
MMDTEDGQFFIKNLAHFVRTHEKALANALQLRRQQAPKHGSSQIVSGSVGGTATPTSPTSTNPPSSASSATTSSTLAAALSLPYLTFASHNIKPAKLALTPHHLFYLLSRFEDLGIAVGPMNVRLENLHSDTSAANYVSFLSQSQRPKGRGGSDNGSIHSVSSVRSVMSGMSSLWSNFGLGAGGAAARTEKQKAAIEADLKYLYSAFTKIPCLRLAPDRRARLIEGYEEFPFDSAVPLLAFKNISALEISDIDIRQFFGWDRMAEQLRSLTVKRAGVDDPADLLINIVLDDMDKRRRRSSKAQMSPTSTYGTATSPRRSPTIVHAELVKSNSAPGSPDEHHHIGEDSDERGASLVRSGSEGAKSPTKSRPRSNSPSRPNSSRTGSAHGHLRGSHKVKRSGSGSSHSSMSENWHNPRSSSSNSVSMGVLPSSKWRFLKHLSLADNGLTSISASSLAPLANTLHSLDLSSNLFAQIPDCLASLTALRALNLSNCMIDSLHSLKRNPLPAISALNLRSNRLISIAGIERLYPLERLDLRDNRMADPTELARLTGIPDIREIWVSGNPFTKTHGGYRVIIFNLFRSTPGYTEDILIDTYAPGYSERRQLVERAAEKANVPVVKPRPQDHGLSTVEVNKPIIDYPNSREPSVLRKERPIPAATTSEIHTSSSGRRRRTPKRRIVDLSTSETSPSKPVKPAAKPTTDQATTGATGSDSGYGISPDPSPRTVTSYVPSEPRQTQSQVEVPRIDTSVVPRLPPIETVTYETPLVKPQTTTSPEDWKVSGEMYRKKLEALRNEVGNGWLSVLSEEGWDSQPNPPQTFGAPDYSPGNTIRPSSTTPRANSQQTIHSGRTLG